MRYGFDDVVAALKQAGLKAGDTGFFTTSLGMVGIAQGIADAESLNRMYLDAIRQVLGADGTILVPTYSYSFGKSTRSDPAVFDLARTPAQTGPFPQFVLSQPGVKRSADPMMSVAGLGPATDVLFQDLPTTSFGEDCLFARLARHPNSKCISIGLGSNWTPFIHHADWLVGVPFRYDKLFQGRIRHLDGQEQDQAWIYSVRIGGSHGAANAHRLGQMAEQQGIWSFAPLGRARVYVADYRDYFDFALSRMADDPWLTGTGPAADPIELERTRLGAPDGFSSHVRACVSHASQAEIDRLAQSLPLTVHRFKSGHKAFDWIVPERWECRSASLTHVNSGRIWPLDGEVLGLAAYSLSVDCTLDRQTLLRHVQTHPAHLPASEDFLNRDWTFLLHEETRQSLPDGDYQARIQSEFALDELVVGEAWIHDSAPQRRIIVCAHLAGPGRDDTGVEALRQFLAEPGAPIPGLAIQGLFVPGLAGLACMLEQTGPTITGIIHLSRSPGFDPHQTGGHPLAKAKMADLGLATHLIGGDSAQEMRERLVRLLGITG